MRILITGGCGFVGSNLSVLLKESGHDIIAMDNLKRRGSELNLPWLKSIGVSFVHGDTRNKEDFEAIGPIDFLIDAAAEPSIQAGLNDSLGYLINTNLIGTVNCLEHAKKYGAGIIFLSTSRVYPIKGLESINYYESDSRFEIHCGPSLQGISSKGINEDFPLSGARSFYGATKLASELLIEEYHEFTGMKTVINRCGVITGPRQMGKVDQGFVVLWLVNHMWNRELKYIGYEGSGKQVRDILHIKDLFDLISLQLNDIEKYNGKTFNVGGGYDNSVSLLELTEMCEEITKNKIKIEKAESRAADVRIYITDNSKIEKISRWKPKRNTATILNDIYDWIKDNEKELKGIL